MNSTRLTHYIVATDAPVRSSVTRQLLGRCRHLQTREQLHVARCAAILLDLKAIAFVGRSESRPLSQQCLARVLFIGEAVPVAGRRGRFASATLGQGVDRYFIGGWQQQSSARQDGR
jgi:hypothetical protein